MAPAKKPKKRKAPVRRPARKKLLDHTPVIIFLLIVCGTVTLCIGTGLAWFLSLNIPDIRSVNDYRPLVATMVLDKRGQTIDAIYEQYRIVIDYREMPGLLPQAFVAAEDSRYWEHGGLDLWSIGRAAINNFRSGKRSQGGSTITQQVTRSLLLSREKSYFRKLIEAILAYRLDRMLSKQEILSIYLNEIYLGSGAYGVEAAARTYFNKPARKLNLAEIAMLAGLPQSPSRYSPLTHFKRAKARQRYVLNRMAEDKIINSAAARRAYGQTLTLGHPDRNRAMNGYFSQYVRSRLEPRYGRKALLRDGLRVFTTLDLNLQKAAAQAVREGTQAIRARHKTKNRPQGALVALDTTSGRILAMVGGTDYTVSQYNRAVRANRQPGSVFKPLVYATAFERGISPATVIDDKPFSIRNKNGSAWSPKNYNNKYYGPTTLTDGLIYSHNIVAIKLLQKTGVKPVIGLAKKAGITAPLKPELPLALGASPVSVLEMTAAYTMFASQGLYRPPVCITRVQDKNGRITLWQQPKPRRVITPKTANEMTSILGQVISRGTGRKAKGIPGAAGKTGTSDSNMDGWFIGYTPEVTAGVWLGYDRDRSLGKGETGGRAAAPVWKKFMQATIK
ncbi:MAG: PBP1A family penicillin-binding protein [Thermodesulfobacteriota bacterium]|nr:PBP1A family penicillin-binding protein [Thermodesulfobacteriota bacterium]